MNHGPRSENARLLGFSQASDESGASWMVGRAPSLRARVRRVNDERGPGWIAYAREGVIYMRLRGELTRDVVDATRRLHVVALAQRPAGCGILLDVGSTLTLPPAEVRSYAATVAGRHPEGIVGHVTLFQGGGFFGATVRSALTGIFMIARSPYPRAVVATAPEATQFLRDRMAPAPSTRARCSRRSGRSVSHRSDAGARRALLDRWSDTGQRSFDRTRRSTKKLAAITTTISTAAAIQNQRVVRSSSGCTTRWASRARWYAWQPVSIAAASSQRPTPTCAVDRSRMRGP